MTQDNYRGVVGNPSTIHRYGYTFNNPLNFIDRWGFNGESLPSSWEELNKRFADEARITLGMEFEMGHKGYDNQIDCSGTVTYTLEKMGLDVGIIDADAIHDNLTIPTNDRSPGTLTFYDYEGDGVFNHVVINTANGRMIHASEGRDMVIDVRQDYIDNTLKPEAIVVTWQIDWEKVAGVSPTSSNGGGYGPTVSPGEGGPIILYDSH